MLPAGVGLALVLVVWTFLGNGEARPVPIGQFLVQAELRREEASVVFASREPTIGQILLSVVGADEDSRD